MKYLEMIVSLLHKGHMVESQRGKAGGYRLIREPSKYTVEEILKLTEGTLSPVNCLESDTNCCERAKNCITLPLWEKLDDVIGNYLNSVTLQDLLDGNVS